MNCAECRDNLVALAERTLKEEKALQCRTHLEMCPDCRAEYEVTSTLQKRLVAHGRSAVEVSVVEPVMRQVLQRNHQPERKSIMSILMKHRWGFGLGAAATAALAILIAVLGTPKIQAAAARVIANGAQAVANLTTIHLRARVRTAPADNFSSINPDADFVPVELWEQFDPVLKWRVDKPGRMAFMDGKSTVLFIKPDFGLRVPRPTTDAFDTKWLQRIANLSRMLEHELSSIKAHGWPVTLKQEQGPDGNPKSVITVEAKSGVPTGDYLQNQFLNTADTRRVYVFDDATERLESARFYVHTDTGVKLIFELDQIDYNQPIDPSVFNPQLPTNVVWEKPMQILPDNQKYAVMTSEEAARTFFEACGREDWNVAGKFCTMTSSLKEELGGTKVLTIGKHFTSAISLINGAQFVPYEIKLKDGTIKKWNLALKRDGRTHRWFVDGGI